MTDPLHAPEAEQAIIGTLLMGAITGEPFLETVREQHLRAGHFYDARNRIIFAALAKLHATGKPYDRVALVEYLRRQQRLDDAGGVQYIGQYREATGTLATAAYYATLVRESALKRSLVSLAAKMGERAYSAESSVMEDLSTLEAAVAEMRDAITASDVLFVDDALDRLVDAEDLPPQPTFSLGLPSLDQMLGPLYPKDIVVIGARPGKGKSSLGEHTVKINAVRGARVLFVPQEMGRKATLERMVARENFLAHNDLRSFSPALRKTYWLSSDLRGKPLFIADNDAPRTVDMLTAEVSRFKPDIVVVDHLRHMQGWFEKERGEGRDEPATRLLKALVQMANKYGVVLILFHQLNRDAEDKLPSLGDFRDTGAIEELAHKVVAIHREPGADIATFAILKNRSGDTGNCDLGWNGPLMKFLDERRTLVAPEDVRAIDEPQQTEMPNAEGPLPL